MVDGLRGGWDPQFVLTVGLAVMSVPVAATSRCGVIGLGAGVSCDAAD